MAVFRIEKKKDYTVMSNHHLRNTKLSLKAKGLLYLIKEHESMKRKRKISFHESEVGLIRKCLMDWRNGQIRAGNEICADVINEILLKFIS